MKRGKVYTLREWLNIGGKISDLNNAPAFSVTGSVIGMRKLYYGYKCDIVKYKGYYYVIF